MIKLALLVLLVAWPLGVEAGSAWCVPDDSIRPNCAHTASTVQAAIDAAPVASVIYVGPGTAPARIVVDKRLTLVCLDGAVLTDTGLAQSATLPVLHITGTYDRPTIVGCRIEVHRSAGAILLDSTAGYAIFKGVDMIGLATPKPQYGLRTWDNRRIFYIDSVKGEPPIVSGFAIGIDSKRCGWLNVEAGAVGGVQFVENGIGIRSEHDKGQIFFNRFRGNDVGIHLLGNHHQDVNANQFHDNAVGIIWGLADTPNQNSKGHCTSQTAMEFNHPVFTNNGTAILVETSPGVFSEDYHDDPGGGVQFTNMLVDGVLMPNHKTTFRTHRCVP